MAKRVPASVLMTADTLGGVWTYALELARGLSSHGLRVELATMSAHPSRQQRMQALSISYLRVHESSYRLEWMDDPWNDVNRAGEWLLNIEHQVRPDIIHLNGYAHADLPWNSPRLVIGHSCVVSWWRYVKKAETPPEWNYYRERVSAGLDKAEVVVAPSQDMLSQLRMHYQWSGPARVIYNGRAPLLPTARKENFLLCAGRLWDEAKNLELVEITARYVKWPVYAAGELLNPNGSGSSLPHVHLLGSLNAASLALWMASASIFLAPAKYEPFGLSILEAALSRCALILGDIPSLHELWDGAALFVPTDDPATLISAIEYLIDNAHTRERLGQEARTRALAFSNSRMTKQYLDVYSELIERASSCSTETVTCG